MEENFKSKEQGKERDENSDSAFDLKEDITRRILNRMMALFR